MKKKAQADEKRQQELEKKRAEQVVSGEAKLTKPAVMAPVVSVQQVVQPAIKV